MTRCIPTAAHLPAVVGPRSLASHGFAPFLGARRVSIAISALCGSLITFALLAPPAFAERPYIGQLTGFSEPSALTVDPEDNLWVADRGKEGLISEFSPSGTLLSHQSGSGAFICSRGLTESSLAVDLAGNLFVYVGQECADLFASFDQAGAEHEFNPWQFGKGEFPSLANIALSEAAGERIYVTQTRKEVSRLDSPELLSYEVLGNTVNFTGSAPYIDEWGITGTPDGAFESVGAITTDPSGDIYVIENSHHVIDEFKPSGEFIQEFTGEHVPGGFSSLLSGLAIDPTTGHLLVVDSGTNVVDEFGPDGAYLAQIAGASPGKPFTQLTGAIALDSAGSLYLAESAEGAVDIFGRSSTMPHIPEISNGPTAATGPGEAELAAEVNPVGSSLIDCHFEYGTSRPFSSSVACEPPIGAISGDSSNHPVSAKIEGLDGDSVYHYRLVVANPNGTSIGPIDSLSTPAPELPSVAEGAALEVGPESALLSAQVDPGFGRTLFRFEYGTDQSYASATPFTALGSADGATHPVRALVTGLTPHTVYHFRIDALNFTGAAVGSDETFRTAGPPAIVSASASEIDQTDATLSAIVNPEGDATTYHFEYGLSETYGARTADLGPLNPGSSGVSVSQRVSGLKADMTYHYRVVATNSVGESAGADGTFSTPAAIQAVGPELHHCTSGQVRKHGKCAKRHRKRHPHRGRGGRHA